MKSKFTTEKVLEDIRDLEWHEILEYLQAQVRSAESELKRNKEDEYFLDQYIKQAKGLYFFLAHGQIPASWEDEDRELFKPVIKNLVRKGNLKKSALDVL